ncbi:MAG: hypothetical protein FWD34_10890 [Oscillospiraceae bacterium]|nr:hypothetical protein [Oscillospiraceae bacterium]
MKRKYLRLIAVAFSIVFFTQSVSAWNAEGEGGDGGGTGNLNNGWAIHDINGDFIRDADGLRIYLVNGKTGALESKTIDITNHRIARNNVFNGNGTTKHEYIKGAAIAFSPDYDYFRVPTGDLPWIIPWNQPSNMTEIRKWLDNEERTRFILELLGISEAEVREEKLALVFEPILYFRYMGFNFALTATEVALMSKFDPGLTGFTAQGVGLGSRLTLQYLPFSIMLSHAAFVGSEGQLGVWEKPRNTAALANDIIEGPLGIGIMSSGDDEAFNNDIADDGGEVAGMEEGFSFEMGDSMYMRDMYRHDRELTRKGIRDIKPIRAVFASDKKYRDVPDTDYYVARSGYYFNPTGTYTFAVTTVTTIRPGQFFYMHHTSAVEEIIDAFRLESEMIYTEFTSDLWGNITTRAVNIDGTAAPKSGSVYKPSLGVVTRENPSPFFDIDYNTDYTRDVREIRTVSWRGTEIIRYIVTEVSVVTITINPSNTKVYTYVNMANDDFMVRAYIDTRNYHGYGRRYMELWFFDEITVKIIGSMYDDVR